MSTHTDAQGKVTKYTYDASTEALLSVVEDYGSGRLNLTTSYAYDALGNITGITDPNNHTTTKQYDALRRVTQVTAPAPLGYVTSYTYDALNRLATRAPQGEPTVTYAYDLTGRVTSVSDTNGAFSYAYDTAGRELSETRPDTKQVAYQYDAAGNRTRVTWPDAYYVSYTFDALNRLSGVLENGTTTLASYDYDAASRRTDLAYGDSSSASYGYAANDDLTSLTQSFTGSSVTFGYGYNNAGQRTSVTVSDGSFLYHPPAASNVSYAPNGVNQYTTVGGASLTHDGNGNLTGDGTASFGYDTENHLVSASALGNTIAYAYDPLGRRASKTVNSTVTKFVWAGNQTIADYDGAGTLLRRYVYGAGLDEPLVTITVSGGTSTKAYNHQDGLGSVVALSDGASGALTDTYAYDPYGQSATLAGNAFRFTGRRLDAESGLYYYRARYYSPSLGRFLQTDPIGTRGGINLYAYVGNDPLNLTDPSGLYARQMGSAAWDLAKAGAHQFGCGYMGNCSVVDYDSNSNAYAAGQATAGFVSAVNTVASAIVPAIVPEALELRVARQTGILANAARGRAAEARVLQDLGLTKNTTAVETAEGRAISDALTTDLSVEIKDAARVSLTRQLRIQTEAARATGRESVLVTGENTCISGACSRAFDTIIRRSDLGPPQ